MNNIDNIKMMISKGDKEGSIRLLVSLVRQDGSNLEAWLLLGDVIDDPAKKRDCYNQVLKLSPNNPLAVNRLRDLELSQLRVDLGTSDTLHNAQPKLQSKTSFTPSQSSFLGERINGSEYKPKPETEFANSTSYSTAAKKPIAVHWSAIITLGVIGIVIVIIFLLTREEPYQPNANDAFSRAAGYALSEMYARDPVNYWCTETETKSADYWYQIQVSDLGNGKYSVIGATKAMDQYCVYETGYFTATVRYDQGSDLWKLVGEVYISNPCLTVKSDGSNNCTMWEYDWEPDMNWRPTK